MAEEFGDKTEEPTPRRLQEAREQGNIPRSQDLTAAVLILGVMLLLKWSGPPLLASLKLLVAQMLGPESLTDVRRDSAVPAAVEGVLAAAAALAPLMAGVLLIAVLVNVSQVGLFASPKRLKPKFSALNPLKGVGKLFKGGHALIQLGMNLLKLSLVGLVVYSAVRGRVDQIVIVQQLGTMQVLALSGELIFSIGLRIGLLLLVLALIDYAYQRFRVQKELRMTKREVKEEMRRMEGDPLIRQRRRQIAQQMAMQRLKKDVPSADVVVTNPTEFAVALKYDVDSMHAPKVVAKGQGHVAVRIRQLGIAAGVPILERPPLARALFRMCEVGQEIPEQFYTAVAEILAYVYELTGRRQRMAG
jgi:flagellar biosynthesis protein FlhB